MVWVEGCCAGVVVVTNSVRMQPVQPVCSTRGARGRRGRRKTKQGVPRHTRMDGRGLWVQAGMVEMGWNEWLREGSRNSHTMQASHKTVDVTKMIVQSRSSRYRSSIVQGAVGRGNE